MEEPYISSTRANSCGGCWLLSGVKSVKCLHLVEWQTAAVGTETYYLFWPLITQYLLRT